MEKGVYLAICYCCNEKCRFCPCTFKEKTEHRILETEKIMGIVDSLAAERCPNITLSGGEPTLHPDFVELVAYIQAKGIKVTILTNGERLSDESFVQELQTHVDLNKIRVITTIHSNHADEHEAANCTPGSFRRSINGLKRIQSLGAKVEIKHCITVYNVKGLRDFYDFCDREFDEKVNIQLCSIDYCGMSKEDLEKEMLPFTKMRIYLESMFDLYLERKKAGSQRKLYCINIPLCACDVYYWKLLTMKKDKLYEGYADPYTKEVIDVHKNVMVSQVHCKECKVADICIGTYRTAFEYYGNRLIKPYI